MYLEACAFQVIGRVKHMFSIITLIIWFSRLTTKWGKDEVALNCHPLNDYGIW